MMKGGQDFGIDLCLASASASLFLSRFDAGVHPGPHGGSVGGRRCAVFAPAAHISVNIQTITPDFTLFLAHLPFLLTNLASRSNSLANSSLNSFSSSAV
ncbi:hypothetical protein QC761_0077550 [Podospora bellae-mahoneyi]|uniref:Uncharacterized protein n=1 Tax=Podospora bellae-mahoneyi TaxID=2093777 RepID=A0ABR0FCS2_9PEZI|nr:hypothetical protein QC761_0077550 [Podospora bellae-mahoneyi]